MWKASLVNTWDLLDSEHDCFEVHLNHDPMRKRRRNLRLSLHIHGISLVGRVEQHTVAVAVEDRALDLGQIIHIARLEHSEIWRPSGNFSNADERAT